MVRVHTRLMAADRQGGRQPGKSDPIDALAVARAALREPDLPVARLDGPASTVKLLSDHRSDLVAERTRLCNRLRWHLHELDPGLQVPSRGLHPYHVLDKLAARLAGMDGVVARIAAELVARCRDLTKQINALERELGSLVRDLGPGAAGHSRLRGTQRRGHRRRDRRGITVPLTERLRPVHRHRPDPGVVRQHRPGPPEPRRQPRRQLRPAHDRGAQARGIGPGKDYLYKQLAVGKTCTEALRLLRRQLSDAAFRALRADEHRQHATADDLLPAAA